jgi:large conductance mechanosensitive channel
MIKMVFFINSGEEIMAMLQAFRQFAMKGNVVDLAVGVIIGAAFGKIVASLVDDVIMPPINMLFGGLDFANYYLPLNHQGVHLSLIEAKKAGAVLAYGNFLSVLINFIILALIIFQVVRLVNRAKHKEALVPVVTPEDIVLLREIRDALKK